MILAIGLTVLFVLYLAECAIWPYANCLYCTGSKKKSSPSGKGFRFCPTCGGKGLRRRFGKFLLDMGKSRR